MKKIIFLILAFLCLFFVKIYGNETGTGLYLLIENPDLRPIEEFSLTKNPEFNKLLETYNVYVFKKAYPTLPSREYLIKSLDDEKLKEELLLKFKEKISFAKVYSFGLEIGIEDLDLLPVEEKQFFLTKNPEFNQLLETYKVDVFLQAFPAVVTESSQKTYMIKSLYEDKLKEELLLKYRESIPLVEEMPDEHVLAYTPNDYDLLGNHAASHLELIKAREAWDITKRLLPKVKVAIPDTYFDPNHEDLSFTFVGLGTNDPNVIRPDHGTSVASCVGAITDNGKGIASIGGFNTELHVSTTRGNDEIFRLAKAGYRVINYSSVGCTYSPTWENNYREIRDVWNAVVVAAAGNTTAHCGSLAAKCYPASYDAVVSVTSVAHRFDIGTITPGYGALDWKDCHEQVIGDTIVDHPHHHNDAVNISAPGYCVVCATTGGGYIWTWGTSSASPIVAGVVAMIMAVNPTLTANEVVDILLSTADASIYSIPCNAPYIGKLGTGRLDAYAAVQAACATLPPTFNFTNQTVTTGRTITHCGDINVQNVTVTSGAILTLKAADNINVQGVTVNNNSKLILDAGGEVNIINNFEVALGSELEIK